LSCRTLVLKERLCYYKFIVICYDDFTRAGKEASSRFDYVEQDNIEIEKFKLR